MRTLKPSLAAQVATMIAVVGRDGPIRRVALQDTLGLSDFQMGQTVGYGRIYGLIRVDAGEVALTEKGRAMLDSDTSSG